jgi:ferredoxin
MTTIVVEHAAGVQIVEVDEPGRLLDLCDEHGIAIPFACRSTTCGTCCTTVVEGADLLEPPTREELALLARLALPDGRRFACAVRVRQANGLVRLRITADRPCLPRSRK